MGASLAASPVIGLNRGTILQGAFDSFEHEHLPRTKYDAIVDETSNKPHEQAFEVFTCSYIVFFPPYGGLETHLGSLPWRNPKTRPLRAY